MSALPAVVRRPPSSAIRSAGAAGRSDVVSLALGEPTWPLPAAARQALAAVDRCGYPPHAGEAALRRAIAGYEGIAPDWVLTTCGAQGALFAAVYTFLGPGDAALVPDPGFPAYRALVELAGGRAVPYGLAAERGFDLDSERVIDTLERTPRARLVFVNHPANPTGGGASAADLRRLAEECARRRVLLVADEVYRELHFGAPSPALRSLTSTGLAVGSLSKAWGAPGLRVGWLAGDPRLLEPCRAVHASMVTSAAGPSQAAACALIDASDRVLAASRRALRRRWRAVAESWREAAGRTPRPPKGGLYRWFPVPGDDVAFCRRAREVGGVALVPGSAFGVRGRGFARLSFAERPRAIRRGIGRLMRCLGAP